MKSDSYNKLCDFPFLRIIEGDATTVGRVRGVGRERGGGKGQDKLPSSQWMHAVVQGSAIRVVVPDRFMDCVSLSGPSRRSTGWPTDRSPSLAPRRRRRRRPAEEAPIYIRNETDKRISGDARTEINLNKAACNGRTTRRRGFADRRRMCRHGTGVEGGKSRGKREGQSGTPREGTNRGWLERDWKAIKQG